MTITNAEFLVGQRKPLLQIGIMKEILQTCWWSTHHAKAVRKHYYNTILEMKPKKVVYVSCNPGTLARDLRILEDGGYQTVEIQPVDMFPMTTHVEAVAKLILK